MNIELKFTKMHGLGNDYVVIDEFGGEIIPENKKPATAEELCKRGFSVGADGVIFVCASTREDADIRFRIFNSDGSEAEMCGNGIRCFAKYVYEKGILTQDLLHVETLGGVKELQLRVEEGEVASVRVNMGISSFLTREIPMTSDKDEFVEGELALDGEILNATVLSVGNPHAVIFTSKLDSVALEAIGPLIEHHEAFPERINAHFVDVLDRDEMEMITWERGSGVTMACGTGATSSVLAGYRLGLLDDNVLVHLPGGELRISVYEQEGQLGAYMEGDAVTVFEGKMGLEI